MEVVNERCCGLDVHKKTVVACMLTSERRETRTYSAMTEGLLKLGDWLVREGVTHVAMESTGVYWQPVYNLLEGLGLELLVVNAQHMKAVPGKKTDVKDAEWIADLLRHGLLRGSYIPPRPQRELRELVRSRTSLVRERSEVVNRIQKALEGANIKLASVASDVVGASGRAMLEAMVDGREAPEELAALARGRLREKRAELEAALQGLVDHHLRFILGSHLRHVDFLDGEIERMDQEVAERMGPFEEEMERVDAIPGVARRTAQKVLVETGVEMGRFPTDAHLSSWAKLCPGNNESAGKRGSGCTGKGNPWLRSALIEAAWAAARTRGTYLSALYHRLAARRGAKRAIVAVAHAILVIIYHLLKRKTSYQDLGPNYFDERNRERVKHRAVHRLEALGYNVILEPQHA